MADKGTNIQTEHSTPYCFYRNHDYQYPDLIVVVLKVKRMIRSSNNIKPANDFECWLDTTSSSFFLFYSIFFYSLLFYFFLFYSFLFLSFLFFCFLIFSDILISFFFFPPCFFTSYYFSPSFLFFSSFFSDYFSLHFFRLILSSLLVRLFSYSVLVLTYHDHTRKICSDRDASHDEGW